MGAQTEVTLSSGAITITGPGQYIVTSESGATDDLTDINGGSEGDIIYLSGTSGDTITVKHDAAKIAIGQDFVLDAIYDKLALIKNGSVWEAFGRENNG
jgi:hypothetical protein